MKGMVGKEILLLLVMFWNVENFFDPFENGPYTPMGEKFWTWKKFSKKRDDIARTVALVGERYGLFPALIGLCEVENRFVLQQLTQNTILAKLDYGIIHRDSPDKRGIDAALLYRKEEFRPLSVQFIPTLVPATEIGQPVGAPQQADSMRQTEGPKETESVLLTREMVYTKGLFRQFDTLHCFVVHWPSKLGGEKESLAKRMAASNTLKHIVDSILAADPRANIVVMGDFNDGAWSEPVAGISNLVNMSGKELIGVSKKEIRREPYRWFSYKYRESWSRIDHFLISRNLWEDPSLEEGGHSLKYLFCTLKSSSVFAHEFLLEKDNKYFGYKIRRTLVGPRYNAGVSDHLPVVLKIWSYEY